MSLYWLAKSSGNQAQNLRDFGLLGAPVVIEWTFPCRTVTYYSWHVVIESTQEVEPVFFNRNTRLDGPIHNGEPESILEAGLEAYLAKNRPTPNVATKLQPKTASTFPLTRTRHLSIARRFSWAQNKSKTCRANEHPGTWSDSKWAYVGDSFQLPRADTSTFTIILVGIPVHLRRRGDDPENIRVDTADESAVVGQTSCVSRGNPSKVPGTLPTHSPGIPLPRYYSNPARETFEDERNPAPGTGRTQQIYDNESDKFYGCYQPERDEWETISNPTISIPATPASKHQSSPAASPQQLHQPLSYPAQLRSISDDYGSESFIQKSKGSSNQTAIHAAQTGKSPSNYWTLDQSTGRHFHIDELPNGRKKTVWYPEEFA